MDWANAIAAFISFISLIFNIGLSVRNWNHRPCVHWITSVLSACDWKNVARKIDKNGRTLGLLLEPDDQHNVYTVFRLINNGNLQASGVRLYCYGCESDAIQRLDKDTADEIHTSIFPYVPPAGYIFVRLWKPGVQSGYQMPDISARFCVYWMDTGHKSDYMRQDFKWIISSSGHKTDTIKPLGHPKRVNEEEYLEGAPLMDEYTARGFDE